MRRLERPTSTSRTWRASQLCYIPKIPGANVRTNLKTASFFGFFFFYSYFCAQKSGYGCFGKGTI